MQTISVDVLVCGGGMSGMACAAFAAESGAKVLVVEKQAVVGAGDPELQAAWMQDYLPAVQWMRENGIPTAKRFDGIMTIGIEYIHTQDYIYMKSDNDTGIGFPIKIPQLHQHHQQRIQNNKTGSQIFTNTAVVKLLQEQPGVPGSRIVGAIIRRGTVDGASTVYYEAKAQHVVLATGGFQGNAGLTSMHLGQGGDNIFVRSNRGSVGDGLTLATAVGAGTSRGMNTYYGHLLAAPLRAEEVDPKDFLPLAQYQSKYCLLINESGRRFADETTGDEVVNQYLAKQEKRRGFLLFKYTSSLSHCVSAPFPNAGEIDRLEKAREHGCNVASTPSLEGLAEILNQWGVDGPQALRTIEQYDRIIRLGDKTSTLDAPVGKAGKPPVPLVEGEGPFFAMEVQPSITFTYGGVLIDTKGRALTPDKTPIPGLLIAGVDGGGFSNLGYAGGLALAFVTGLWAARTIATELKLPVPQLPAADVRDAGSEEPVIASRL
ncbi:hypothetical protein APSETT444_010692 [Aspergillus pseudonomiae]